MSQANLNAITWFEIPTADLDRATRFWETVLGVSLKRERIGDEDLAIFTRPAEGAVAGALIRNERAKPSATGTRVYLDARGDLDGAIERAARAGGKVVLPRTDIGPPGFIAMVMDTEGNLVGLHSPRA